MSATQLYFDHLNKNYLTIHKTKEDLFWKTYMGTSDDHKGFAEAENAFKDFISNADRIQEIKKHIETVKSEPESNNKQLLLKGLKGWLSLFKCNAVEDQSAKEALSALIKMEADLFAKRQSLTLNYINDENQTMEASTLVLRSNLATSKSEVVRKSSHDGFLTLEKWVVNNGYIDLVKQRNRFAQSLGYENFFDYSVQKNEAMTPKELFTILDDFEERTRDVLNSSLKSLARKKGETALKAHNFRFFVGGDVEQQLDAYFPFTKSIERWVRSFKQLGIQFRDASLTLDLMDRKGKYENGFMHGPVPCFYNNGEWQAAEINFTSNANPDKIGSGREAIATLFHEGGHAAHCANVTQNAPCFSQEFAPTSMAYAETQSMFCDSLLDDADWMKTYAKNEKGEAVPDSLIKKMIEAKQPFFAYEERMILVVPYFEWAVYSLNDRDLTAAKLISLARETEQRILGIPCSPRPILAIPHLLSQESACSYQGYLLAHMAVYQTRAWFLEKFGYLTDNPELGPLLAKHYWHPGNSISHDQSLKNLTGEGFSAQYLADICNLSINDAWESTEETITKYKQRPAVIETASSLNAKIRVVHGEEMIANNDQSDQNLIQQFETWVKDQYKIQNRGE
ncbi:MAG: peptidase M3 [Deltaproteobacteria bacterium]|jgi:Zn-dependent oligopeptidase|nr:peptidase M3 [Deltaproteobacteria bacterium]